MKIGLNFLRVVFTLLITWEPGSAAESSHGLAQVEHLFQDRPNLKQIVPRNGTVWNFLVESFTNRIYWDSRPPNLSDSYHSSFNINSDASTSIHVDYRFREGTREGEILPPQQILACVVYELYNVKHENRFQELDRMVRSGEAITRDDYVMEMSKEEHDTMMSVQQFYLSTWSPYALDNHIDPCPQYWHRGILADFGMWFRSMPRDGYPWDVYGKFYDQWRNNKSREEENAQN